MYCGSGGRDAHLDYGQLAGGERRHVDGCGYGAQVLELGAGWGWGCWAGGFERVRGGVRAASAGSAADGLLLLLMLLLLMVLLLIRAST